MYQYNLAQELGETADGVKELRGLLQFLPAQPDGLSDTEGVVGFGESSPKDGQTVDGSSVPEDRRVELLLFEEGHEPDLAVMNEEPKVSEFYMRDALVREEIARRPGGVTSTVDL